MPSKLLKRATFCCRINVVFAVNEGVVYISATAPQQHERADMVLAVDNDADGAGPAG